MIVKHVALQQMFVFKDTPTVHTGESPSLLGNSQHLVSEVFQIHVHTQMVLLMEGLAALVTLEQPLFLYNLQGSSLVSFLHVRVELTGRVIGLAAVGTLVRLLRRC